MNSIDEKLWAYIDGTCTADECQQLEHLLNTDVDIRQQYEQFLAIHAEFATLELDEPSMAFSYNVMEQIRKEEALAPLKAKVDRRIIYMVAGFFVVTIASILLFTFWNLGWTNNPTPPAQNDIILPVKLTIAEMSGIFNGNLMKYFLFFDMILAMFMADAVIRKRKKIAADGK